MSFSISRFAFFVLLLTNSIFPQTTYFVSQSGNNSNTGLNENDAFGTLQYAADMVSAGDSVFVMEGTYSGFDLRTSGMQNFPIVFKAINENVIINQPNPVTSDGINIESADWIIVDGFNVINQPRAGIRIVTADFVTIRNNNCSENYKWGIFTGFTDDILIENNSCSYSEDEHGIYVSNSSDRPVIINNHSFFNNGCGIHMNGDLSMGGDGIISNAVVAGNIIHDNGNGGGSAINMDCVQESEIFNNLIYNNHSTGIAMYMIDGAEGSKNNKVYNNTIVSPTNTRWNIIAVNGSTGNTLLNNILINNHSFRGSISIDESSSEGFISDYNLLEDRLSNDDGESNMSISEWQALGYDLHSEIADPEENIFVNHSSGNFQLKENSQPIDLGTSLVSSIVDEDIINVIRPQGVGFDIGAYEYSGALGIDDKNLVEGYQLYQNYPNPFNPGTIISYQLTVGSHAVLKIYNVLGKEIITLVNEEKSAGIHEVKFDASKLSSGVYYYKLKAGDFSSIKKMIYLK